MSEGRVQLILAMLCIGGLVTVFLLARQERNHKAAFWKKYCAYYDAVPIMSEYDGLVCVRIRP